YHLGGYCWGGLVAFELARQLRLAGEDVGLLALIDCPFPGFRQTRSLASRARGRARLGWELVRQNVARVRELAPRQIPPFLWQRLVNLVTRVAGRPAYRWSVRIGRPLLPAFRELANAFHQAGLAYRPGTYPGRIQVLYAAGNRPGRSVDAFAGWTRVATGGVEFYEVPGMHRTMMQEPHVERLSTQLLAILERPLAEPATE
ncbi:MAG: thioesterase domain-containing protein, partial [candidate division NC10 bacterium]|nr:thioesterase domain-containing protein [candidate division NC10 bacterium]